MNRIEKLIAELCPDGVEWKKLGEVAELKRGTAITKDKIVNGDIPVIAGGRQPAYFHNEYNREGETIVVAGSGAYAGYVSYWNKPIFVSDAFSIKAKGGIIITKYLYYYLLNKQEFIHSKKKGSGVPHVHIGDIISFPIPIPPLPIQEEIVKILDTFTELEKELEKELEARKKQYEYYRNKLLTPVEKDGRWYFNGKEVEWKKLGEVCEINNGYTPSKLKSEYWENGTIPWFRMDDIRMNGFILDSSLQKINEKAIKGNKIFPANSILVATSATIGVHALITVPHLANQRFVSLSIKDVFKSKLKIKFLFYYFYLLDQWCIKNVTTSSFSSVDMNGFKKFPIPIPPLSEQERIVAILDKFDALVNDISQGLPAEIEARRKQYEYYRNKLLNFSNS
jgi:type I restriction enzyme S subunit